MEQMDQEPNNNRSTKPKSNGSGQSQNKSKRNGKLSIPENAEGSMSGSTTETLPSLSFTTSTVRGNDDAGVFGQLVTHKLRLLNVRNAIMAETDIMHILQKFVLADLEDDDPV